MASTIVCQDLQSCLDPQVKTQEIKNDEKKNNGWSFFKVLDNPSMNSKNLDQNDDVYVHPMVKRNASALSTKSLEMCTESLGSETGSDISESGDEFCVISMEERERLRAIQRSKYRNFGRKIHRSEFPPPLTSISGSDGTVKVRHHREGGRLVIKADSFSNCSTNFQAERTNGRLKLSLMRDCSVNYESERAEMEEYEEDEEEGDEVELLHGDDDEDDDVAEEEEEVVAEDMEEEGGGGVGWRWDMDGNRWRIAGRCKEGGNGDIVFANWGSSWVAIS